MISRRHCFAVCSKGTGENYTKERKRTGRLLARRRERVVSTSKSTKRRQTRSTKQVAGGPSDVDALHKQELLLPGLVQAAASASLFTRPKEGGTHLLSLGELPY